MSQHHTKTVNVRVKINGEANIFITSYINILHVYKDTILYPVEFIDEGGAMPYTGVIIYYLHTMTTIIPIKMMYSESTSETMLLPTDIVVSDQNFNLDK